MIESKLNSVIPQCIKIILQKSGYDSEMSLTALNENNLSEIELHIQKNHREIFTNLDCCHSQTYRNQREFKLLPGHKGFILKIPEKLNSNPRPHSLSMICQQLVERSSGLPTITNLLKELLEVAVKNENKSKTQYRYSDVIQFFSIYVYILSGRNCYEILSNNLPMPKVPTICEIFLNYSISYLFCRLLQSLLLLHFHYSEIYSRP